MTDHLLSLLLALPPDRWATALWLAEGLGEERREVDLELIRLRSLPEGALVVSRFGEAEWRATERARAAGGEP